MTPKELQQKIVEEVLLKLHAQTIVDRDVILGLAENEKNSQALIHREVANVEVDFNYIAEEIIRIRGATTSLSTLTRFKSDTHQEWLDRKRQQIENGKHWSTFRRYISRSLSEKQVNELDRSSDEILSSIEDPERSGSWKSRGLVIGDVQSGKTTNFIALSNKALDAGYKAIVVLSGLHNNLRQQTQVRFEEGVSGWNTNSKPGATKACGVSLSVLPPLKSYDLKCGNLTTREDNGDFLSNKDPGMKFGEAAVYSVNKKNYRTLENLIEFFRSELEGIGDASSIPLLLIDDEADNASIDTTKPDDNPSTINRLIKELLALFPRCSYIGYTATPFANILMDQQNDDELFPRNFIMVLGRPDNYIGAARVFGTVNDDADEDDDGDAEAIVRDIELDWFVNLDQEPFNSDWKDFIPFPNKLDSLEHMDRLPESLEEAVYSFIISICIRNLRGDEFEHKTMLIHATRLIQLQHRLQELVNDFIEEIYAAFAAPQVGVPNKHLDRMSSIFDERYPRVDEDWQQISPKLMEAISLVRGHVYGINGDQRDVIDEDEFVNGLHSIRIGGDKLSRGLTLPGLMTSYFLRVSRMYDTLMQMGRWFGYRDKYQDICQIYTTGLLFNWFGHVANASESLRSRIIEMNSMDLTPLDYQQRIQSHPGRMLVTALNKQYHTKPVAISFAGTLAQLTSFALDEEGVSQNEANSRKVSALMEELENSDLSFDKEKGARIFHDVDFKIAADFVERFEHTNEAGIWNRRALAGYIRNMASKGELTNWTIAFQNSTKAHPGTETRTIGSWNMTSNFRSGKKTEFDIFTMSNSSLVSETHEKFDFPKDARAALKTRNEIRESRPITRGLLIVYFVTAAQKNPERIFGCVPALGISFPQTGNAEKVTFVASVGDNVPDFRDDDFG